ncbi:MAG: transposase [Porphyromonadaceae bacterium]|nr:transposase [Porphyromonadaceae bacterium]
MAIHYSEIVPIPTENVHKCGKYIYLILSREYSPLKKCNNYEKKAIGLPIDDKTMYPNDNYYLFFGQTEDHLEEPDPDQSDCQKIGSFALIRSLLDSLGLREKLELVFGEKDARLIADLASYFCLSGSTVMQHFPAWAYEHPILSDSVVSDSTISRFLQHNISDDDVYEFFKQWNADRDTQETLYVNGDATNMNTEATGVELAEMGYAKDDPTKPQVNISLAATHKDNMPLFYDLYSGSYNDMSEFHYMIRMASDFGYKNLGFILDRGYFTQEILDMIASLGYQLIIMLKDNNRCVREMIQEVGTSLKQSWSKYIPEHEVYGITKRRMLYKSGKQNYAVHLYYSDQKAKKERDYLVTILQKYEKALQNGVEQGNLKAEEAKKYAKYFDVMISVDGFVTGFHPNEQNIDLAYSECGFFAIATSEDLGAEEALDIYRERDAVEKLFESMKTGMDCKKFRVYSDESLKTKAFIVFVATILRSQIHRGLKSIRGTDKKNFTVPAAIHELEKVLAIRQPDGTFVRSRKLTAQQKKILSAFDVSDKDVTKLAKEI